MTFPEGGFYSSQHAAQRARGKATSYVCQNFACQMPAVEAKARLGERNLWTMNLADQLAQLETEEIVRRASDADPAYLFYHALTQETAYASLLKKKRRGIHWQVAQALEAQYAEQLEALAPLLSQHYAEAGDEAKTLHYSIRAADGASRIFAHAEAILYYTRALDIARRGEDGDQVRALYLRLGRELELSSQFSAALAHYVEMEQRASERGDRVLELAALTARCQIRCTPTSEFDPAQGEPLARNALQLAGDLGDEATQSKILWILVNLYRLTNRLEAARAAGEQSLQIARALDLREQMAFALNDLAHVYGFSGNFKRERESIQEATRLWRELGNLPMIADSLATASMYDAFFGEFDEAIAGSDQAQRLSQTTGNLWGQTYCLQEVGSVYWMRGEISRAMDLMQEALRLSEQSGYPVPQLSTRAELGMVLGSLGAFEQGLEHARRALAFANSNYPVLASIARGALVQIYLWMNDPAEAMAVFRSSNPEAEPENFFALNFKFQSGARLAYAQSDFVRVLDIGSRWVEWLNAFTIRTYLPEAFYLQGLAERGLGQIPAARASWRAAREHAEQLYARWPLWQILGAWGDMEAADGNRTEAEPLLGQARELIRYIADHAPSALRESFLNLPRVRKVENSYVEKSSEH